MDSNSIINIIKLLCTYFNDNEIDYVIVGGISVIAWGRTRTTEDIDIIMNHHQLNIEDFVTYLQKNNFFADTSDFEGFLTKDHCTIFYKEGLFRVDITGVYTPDNKISIKEARSAEFHGVNIKLDSPESLIAHKIVFGSQQDLEDASAIYTRLKQSINQEKMFEHAKRLHVQNKLKKLLDSIKNVD